MAVAVFIISLLLGSILVPLTTQVNQRRISDTQKMLEEIKEALVGFAIVNGYLPCPAVSAVNGAEDRTGTACTGGKRQGFIPWATLGASKLDGWGHVIRYSVTPAYTSSASLFSLSTAADITILTRNSAGALVNLSNLNAIPAVVMSYGQNGHGGVNDDAAAVALPTGWPGSFPDENTNATNGTIFVSRVLQEAGAGGIGGEFDDVVAWLSPHILFNRMVAAGKLP